MYLQPSEALSQPKRGRAVFVTSGKGGVGKSTFCAYLGGALARRGDRVAIIELDAGLRGLDLLLGVGERIVFDLEDLLCARCELEAAMVSSPIFRGVELLPAPSHPDARVEKEPFLQLLGQLQERYDFLLLDSPAGFGRLFQLAAQSCRQGVLVVTPDPVCVRDAAAASELLRRNGLEDQYICINKVFLKKTRFNAIQDFDSILDSVGAPLLGVIPYEQAALSYFSQEEQRDFPCRPYYDRIAARLCGEYQPLLII